MDWSALGISLVATRAVHFAATAIVVGSIIFRMAVARAVLRSDQTVAASFQAQTVPVASAGLVVIVISGIIWLLLQAASMSGLPLDEALSADVLSTVIDQTQFGEVSLLRLALAICLGTCLAFDRFSAVRWLGLGAALGLAASLAWTGHAGSSFGAAGYLQLAADVLHIVAAAAWIGGLLSLIRFLALVRQTMALPLARTVAERFSILGIVSVATLALTGMVNAAMLVGSLQALATTEYGQVLTLKLAMFAAMLALAAVNRVRLTPQFASHDKAQSLAALRHLVRNSAIEIAFALGIIAVVAVLGTMHPAIHALQAQ